jgi:predicted nuclease of predicted toxin-antitoxin system
MRFLADECCDFAVVRALRSKGHDVLAVSEFETRSVDANLMDLAHREGRILLTEDKDFGWLAFAAHLDSAGVVLMRFPSQSPKQLGDTVTLLVEEYGDRLSGAFVVLRPGSVRISAIPR